jgi:hypothetical protein
MLGTGAIGGYSTALGAINTALQEIDALARKIAGEMNTVHSAGLDLTGAPGGPMFSLDGWVMSRAVTIHLRWMQSTWPASFSAQATSRRFQQL